LGTLLHSSVVLVTVLSYCKGSFGGCQGQPSARPRHLLLRSLVLFIGSSPVRRLLPILIVISSSSIDSLVIHARLACSLPYALAMCFTPTYITSPLVDLTVFTAQGSVTLDIVFLSNYFLIKNISLLFTCI
jgi:hypothetical protein